MTPFEIVLLAGGLLIFIISFFLPDKENKAADISGAIGENEIRALIEEEIRDSRGDIDDMTTETIEYSMEKAERTLERITNEKLMAIGEFSDSVMNGINANHQENLFLHDMLNRNKDELAELLNRADQSSRDASAIANDAYDLANTARRLAEEAFEQAGKAGERAVFAEEKMIDARKAMAPADVDAEIRAFEEGAIDESFPAGIQPLPEEAMDEMLKTAIAVNDEPAAGEKTAKKAAPRKKRTAAAKKPKNEPQQMQLSFPVDILNTGEANNNERILEMHRMGRSNMAIAKELGLGIGEVKLVIDLFENS